MIITTTIKFNNFDIFHGIILFVRPQRFQLQEGGRGATDSIAPHRQVLIL